MPQYNTNENEIEKLATEYVLNKYSDKNREFYAAKSGYKKGYEDSQFSIQQTMKEITNNYETELQSLKDKIDLLEGRVCVHCGSKNIHTEGNYSFCKDCDTEMVD